MRHKPGHVFAALLAAALSVFCAAASAQDYPNHPITLVVPFAPGGGNDTMARLVAQHMSQTLGQQVIVDNRAGAGGTIGTRFVARAAPDGYTLLLGHSGVMGVGPSFYPNVGYDPRKDFEPLGLIASLQYAMVVTPSLPANTVAEFIALTKKQQVNYASAGVGSGSHIATEHFAAMAGIQMTHVPYRGTGPALNDLVGGHIAMHMGPIPALIGLIRGGSVRAIGVTGMARSPVMPDVATANESGLPGYETVLHYGLLAPAGTPKEIVEKLNKAMRAALTDKNVRARIIDDGGEPVGSTPVQHAAYIDSDEKKWGSLVRKLNLKAE